MNLFLFDIDGTLIQAGGAGRRALEQALFEVFGQADASHNIRFDGKTDRSIIREIANTNFVVPESEMSSVIDRVLERYLHHLPTTVQESAAYQVLPGIFELLEALAKDTHAVLGLATGNVQTGAAIKLERGKLNHYFSFGGYGCDSEQRSELVSRAIERAESSLGRKIPRQDIVVIGDTQHDIEAGKFVGAKTVAVATGSFKTHELANYAPDFLLENFSDWREFLRFFA